MERQTDRVSVSRGRSLFIWGLLCALAGLVLLVYVAGSVSAGGGQLVMPLDDAYIHFQYARVLAEGHPYQYNPGLPPSSGATSFLYPYLLAVGYLLGFQGLSLGLWAMGIGALALALMAWIVYRFGLLFQAPVWLAAVVAAGFELNGAVTWHAMSGMETGLAILFTFYTLYAVACERYGHTIAGAALVALIRPEGAIVALLALAAVLWRWRMRIRSYVARTLLPRIRRQLSAANARDALALRKAVDALVSPAASPEDVTEDVGARHAVPLREDSEADQAGAQRAAPLQGADVSTQAVQTPQSRTQSLRALMPSDRRWLWLLLPIFAMGVQPLVNVLLTGSWVASGSAAKSLFGMVPFDFTAVMGRVWDNFWRMWWGFFSASPSSVTIGGATMALAGFGLSALGESRKHRTFSTILTLILLLGTLAISTLDTAFWHFKRYQMPIIGLLIVLAIPGVTLTRWPSLLWKRFATALLVIMSAGYVLSFAIFLGYYTLNVGYVADQPLPMARWIDTHTPPDAVIAVHDTGSLRYIGSRTTIDMVGLTTPGAAESWRNGPGAVAEFLERKRPDYIASYGEGHGYGLGYLEATGLYAETLAQYTVELDPNANVALAASTQGIYRPQWDAADRAYDLVMLPLVTPYVDGMSVYDEVDVADVYSEHVHSYQWRNDEPPEGFPTEVYQFPYIGCTMGENCIVMDGGRRINADERFTLSARPGQDMVLVTRLHPANAGTYDVFANDVLINSRVVPALPGGWLEVPILIPGALVTEQTRIHIVPRTAGNFYMPYQHWAFQGEPYAPAELPETPLSTFQDGAIAIYDYDSSYETGEDGSRTLVVSWLWGSNGDAQGDYKIFVHLLNANDAIAAQADIRPGAGTLPPGNWLPGSFHETIRIDVSALPAGTYRVALGLYDAVNESTLMPTGGDEFGRLFVDEIEIP
jgi:hypothetical protein